MRQAWDARQAEIAYADRLSAGTTDLDAEGQEPAEGPVSLRWVLTHLLEEHARHNGRADLLRRRVDGTIGL